MAVAWMTELLERDAELARIADAVDAAGRGSGGVVFLQGQGGIGKTRLLGEGARVAEHSGLAVLRARGRELERDVAFGIAFQLVEPVLADAEHRAELLEGAAALVAPVLERGAVAADDDPRALLHGMFWLLANLAESRSVALLVDDAHLADDLSLRFLLYLAQRVDELPVAVLVAARPAERGPAAEVLAALRAHRSTTRLEPAPLSREAVARLVERQDLPAADATFVDACAEVTAGNPLYLTELLRVLTGSDAEPTVERVRHVGPRAVAEAVLVALARHPPEATRFARALAVLGDGTAVRYA
ncbi:MAG TPA: ATP-binding protein, partial [Solirubrobacteraceae bacterium]|nr:ATP-binding protein [Solirubrobacteraceae bacterium]